MWPWNLTDDLEKQYGTSSMLFQALCSFSQPLVYLNWSYSPETPNLGQIRWFLEPCDLEIWRMTLKNNRAPLLCCFQLCAWFPCHMWIQTRVKVRKRLGWVLTSVTLTFDIWQISWWYDDGNMVKKVWRMDGRTDGRTDYTSHIAAWSQLKFWIMTARKLN